MLGIHAKIYLHCTQGYLFENITTNLITNSKSYILLYIHKVSIYLSFSALSDILLIIYCDYMQCFMVRFWYAVPFSTAIITTIYNI
jgi:hypothetical protein